VPNIYRRECAKLFYPQQTLNNTRTHPHKEEPHMNTPQIKLEPKQRTAKIIEHLQKLYPNAKTALNYTNPLELLVATMLSAQTTDVRVNIVTQTLFKKYPTAQDYANADLTELESDIHSTGFYHNKAKNLKACCQLLVDKFGASSQNNGGVDRVARGC